MPTLWHFTIFFKFKQIKIRIILINVHGAHQTFYHDHEGNVRELKSGIVYLFHLIYWQHGHKAVLWQTLFDKLVADIFLSFLLLMCQQAYTFLIPSLLYKFIKTVLSLGFTKLTISTIEPCRWFSSLYRASIMACRGCLPDLGRSTTLELPCLNCLQHFLLKHMKDTAEAMKQCWFNLSPVYIYRCFSDETFMWIVIRALVSGFFIVVLTLLKQ